MEKAAEASGSRFAYLLGDLVMVELALIRFAVETVRAEGFEPVVPPVLVREGPLYGTGFFPGEREMIYEIERDELFLVGTSEVSLAALHADEILEAGDLPRRYAGSRPAFAARPAPRGKDTRGIFRVHQFDKVEMFSFVRPEDSAAEHERILAIEERILGALELPYRVVDIPIGDLGAPAARKFDCEAWIPSQERYRELTSCSNTTDYQARRLGARFRPEPEAPAEVLHTLNGTAVAVGRTLIALIENGQREDGSCDPAVRLPDGVAVARRARATPRPSPSSAIEVQRAGVDAVAQAGRVRAVVEDVAEVAAAALADDLGAAHEEAVVGPGLDRVVVHRVEEARPAGAGVELGVGAEQLCAAAATAVDAVLLVVPVGAGERALGALLAEDLVLLGRELRPPLRLGLLDLLHRRLLG